MSRSSYFLHLPLEERKVGPYRTIQMVVDIEVPVDQARLQAAIDRFQNPVEQSVRLTIDNVDYMWSRQQGLQPVMSEINTDPYCDAIDCVISRGRP